MQFFVNGPNQQGRFSFVYLLEQGTTDTFDLICNGHYHELQPVESNVAVHDSVSFEKLGVTGDKHYHVSYQVVHRRLLETTILFTGSIPFIPLGYRDYLQFGFFSCNDNPAVATITGNTYFDGQETGLFQKVQDQRNDVVVHLGDNVYVDSVWEAFAEDGIDRDMVYSRLRQYYIRSYADISQGQCMRHGYQMQMVDDHDFMDGYGTPGFHVDDRIGAKLREYEGIVQRVHKELMITVDDSATHIGKYALILLETRHALRAHGTRFPPNFVDLIDWVGRVAFADTVPIVCMPQPLVHLDHMVAYFMGLYYSDAVDDSQHPRNRVGANHVTNAIHKLGPGTIVVSGDIHQGFIQEHGTFVTELVTSGISRKCVDHAPWWIRWALCLNDVISIRRWTTTVGTRRNWTFGPSAGGLRFDRPYLLTPEDVCVKHVVRE
jgi:hypothetical protein